ncbi:NAD-glutamate dehydrogenase [Litorivicinus lipolyticus]|uniref:NAD-glutamate dehydrogenase n=1 Tax=Litorivicinus lipolyticus TaxID=418701 RepID=A0A5Q2Q7B3_9GAMM|nr:NAD-glutamate dehydrogenase [Litorivicinus lipolyticus]QGG80329.1 NAD-glutamate dehydrogenase [Litorivicinus lipolyticus]
MSRSELSDTFPQSITGELARRLLSVVPDEDVCRLDLPSLLGRAQWIERLLASGEHHVQVFNPNAERDGWDSRHTLVAVVLADQPFLVDTVRLEIRRQQHRIHLTQNLVARPVVEDGTLSSLDAGEQPHAVMILEIDRIDDLTGQRALASAIQSVLRLLGAAVDDFMGMRDRCRQMAESQDEEGCEFFNWLAQDHFTFLGYEQLSRTSKSKSGTVETELNLGISRVREGCGLGDELSMQQQPGILFTKAPERSKIHRGAYIDLIVITEADGKGAREHRFYGLFTSRVYQEMTLEIPLVRQKIQQVLDASGFARGGHNYKQLSQILQVFPRDELLQIDQPTLSEQALVVLRLQERERTRLMVRVDPLGHFATALLYIPRDRYDTRIRTLIQEMLATELAARDIEFNTTFSESVHTRVQFIIRLSEPVTLDPSALQARVELLVQSWDEQLRIALADAHGDGKARALLRDYCDYFPAGYREDFDAKRAVLDINHLAGLSAEKPMDLSLFHDLGTQKLHLKLFHFGAPIPLSDALPIMEHLGARVLADQTYASRNRDWYIHDFTLDMRSAAALADWRDDWQDAFAATWYQRTESDAFHGLVLSAGLNWREVSVLRALSSYIKQIGFELSREWIAATLVANPVLAKELIALFRARHEPGRADALEARVLESLNGLIEEVAGLNEDRLFRRYRDVIGATLRVNFFQPLADDQSLSLAFKIAPRSIEGVPKPVPLFEIFVYSARVEGVHLRGGSVARGGLRWSDRHEDYRTEVLGLVKAQQVKNSVIVPEGAKGGFVPKQLPRGDREATQREAICAYKEFISGLLALTDNLVENEIVAPPSMRRHDADDPYLVVAADKGTATFSDIANGIAVERGFWLGDAFASGGSAGYDHKGMGITAKGAWVSVIHHFRELGKDPAVDKFTAVGIGDMSGDVFGNGMLLSNQMKLLAAFNHLHIFIDPTPDPQQSFDERTRLFALPRSGWADYDVALISPGGAIFDRTAKSLVLSPEAAKALGLKAGKRTPNELIKELLTSKVDLLWNGGIGTYAKAARESHADVGDKANDAIRVDGAQLGAAIVGEGGNLGLTQLGRVEMALNGCLVNTDFIDNSAGVDCSDHEVNLKILLAQRERAGELTRRQRDRLLESKTDEVSALVLANNDRQAGALGVAASDAPRSQFELMRFIETLEAGGELDPELEGLPRDLTGRGPLTRPELAVLLATAKNRLKRSLILAVEDDTLAAIAAEAFPPSLRDDYAQEIAEHRLRPQLVATQLANAMVHYLGIAVTHRLEALAATDSVGVAKAFQVARICFDLDRRWGEIESLPASVSVEIRRELLLRLSGLMRRVTRWILRRHGSDYAVADLVERYQGRLNELSGGMRGWLYGKPKTQFERLVERWVAAGVPEAVAEYVAGTPSLTSGPSVVESCLASDQGVHRVTELYLALGERMGLHDFARHVNGLRVQSTWEARARDGFRDDIDRAYQAFSGRLLACDGAPADALDEWVQARPEAVAQWQELIDAIEAAGDNAYPVMAVAGRTLALLPDAER